jgi:hypothetical protein
MSKLQKHVDDINENIEKLGTRGPVSKYVLPEENLRGRCVFFLALSPWIFPISGMQLFLFLKITFSVLFSLIITTFFPKVVIYGFVFQQSCCDL